MTIRGEVRGLLETSGPRTAAGIAEKIKAPNMEQVLHQMTAAGQISKTGEGAAAQYARAAGAAGIKPAKASKKKKPGKKRSPPAAKRKGKKKGKHAAAAAAAPASNMIAAMTHDLRLVLLRDSIPTIYTAEETGHIADCVLVCFHAEK